MRRRFSASIDLYHFAIHCTSQEYPPTLFQASIMPPSCLSKSMAEKTEVVTWIELHRVTPAKAADQFQNERGWKVSAAQVRYWWKQKESIKNAPVSNLRLRGAGAKPRLAEVEDMIFD
ncbi:hypothetical protein Pcac1_g25330 [Phytophthora cactorum]|nr:hypothetical protein Pcac1_g25330 [Phytophthora cactorum]